MLTLKAESAQAIDFAPSVGQLVAFDDGLSGIVCDESPPENYKGKVIRTWAIKIADDQWRSVVKIEVQQ